ncbi:MAG: sensor histidine kinase [Nitrososphaera sp.]|jgi:signal transduction histidine kinase
MLQRKSIFLVVLIAAGATTLSVASYLYLNSTSNEIINLARQDIHDNAKIEANAISHALSAKITEVSSNLGLLSQAPAVQDKDMRAQQLFDSSQAITSGLTDGYYWLDRNGKIITYSEINTGKFPDYRGDDLSYRDYYQMPKQSLKPYTSTVLDSRDGVPRLYLSNPIIASDGKFDGVIVAAISTKNAGSFVQSQLLPEYRSTAGLMDKDDLILYTSNQTLIGTHYYDATFQSVLPEPLRPQFNSFLERSKASSSEIEDITYGGNTVTIVSREVQISGEHVWTAYVVYPHILTDETISLLNQQRSFSIMIIAGVGVASVFIAAIVLIWNRRLETTVQSKTAELQSAVGSLTAANQQLKEHDKLQQEFINIAAHELRTPITPIITSLYIAEMASENKPEIVLTREQYDIIRRNSKRLESLARNILDVSRIESGKFKLDKEVFDMNVKISNVIKDAASWMPPNGPNIEAMPLMDSSGKVIPALVYADKTKIFEVVANLLRNAIRFSPSGTISISIERIEDNHIAISIRDTGSGIDPKVMPRLFQKFASSQDMGGTGLGLFISRSIVEAHGGKMWAENNKDGKGATFVFTLPLHLDQS